MIDEALAKRRFFIFMGLRLLGLVIFFAGMAISFGDVLRVGGWPQLGAFIVIVGVVGSILVPKLVKRRWDRP
ncbi:MAG: hypothetical protein ABIW16_02825 [Sphingomicrobium sp.]